MIQDMVSAVASAAPVPGVAAVAKMALVIYEAVDKVKVCRRQCKDLGERCKTLSLTLQESSEGMVGTNVMDVVDVTHDALSRIHSRVTTWAKWNMLQSIVSINTVTDGIDKSYRDIDTCMNKFHISVNMELHRSQRHVQSLQERSSALSESDAAEFRWLLQKLVKNVDTILGTKSPEAVDSIMTSLQTELHREDLESDQETTFRAAMWELHQGTARLPPLPNLTGQIEKTSDEPVAYGTYNDIYQGKWLNNEVVALRRPRMLSDASAIEQQVKNEIIIWRKFHHPNVTPLYGMVYIGEHVYTVSPWMDNGTAITYVQQNPSVDRLKLLSEVAAGMEYLHNKSVVHGDLRGANILISREGVARITDFGLSKLLAEAWQGLPTVTDVNPRWFAPELITHNESRSKSSDVWSFGMVCLELMTGEPPYSNIHRDVSVTLHVSQGKLPERPTARVLSDELWALMKECWAKKSASRPTMTSVKAKIDQIYRRSQAAVATPASLTYSPESVPKELTSPRLSIFARRPTTADSGSSGRSRWSIPRLRKKPSHTPGDEDDQDSYSSPGSSTLPTPSPGSIRTQHSSRLHPSYPSPPSLLMVRTEFQPDDGDTMSVSSPSSSRRSEITSYTPLDIPRLPIPFGDYLSTDPPPSQVVQPNGESSLLAYLRENPTTDADLIVREDRNGFVISGTVEGLIERLINNTPKDTRLVAEYRETFLWSYTAFTTAELVFKFLAQRFCEAENLVAERRGPFRFSVITMIEHWLASPHDQIDTSVLMDMKKFTRAVDTSGFMTALATRVAETIEFRVNARHSESQQLQDSAVRDPPNVTPSSLANALTILEGRKYKDLLPADYIAHLLHPAAQGHMVAASTTHRNITSWVKKSILTPRDFEARAEVFKFFVNTAIECNKLHNFSGVAAIAGALQSPAITSLCSTKWKIQQHAPHLLKSLSTLEELIGDSPRYSPYRKALKKIKGPCVPWLDPHLLDLRSIFTKNGANVEYMGRRLINWKRYTEFCAWMKETSQYQPPELDSGPSLAYLEAQLRSIPAEPNMEEWLEKRSRELADDEKRIFDQRLPQFRSVGFRI